MTDQMGPFPPECQCGDDWDEHGVTNDGANSCFTIVGEFDLCGCDGYVPGFDVSSGEYREWVSQILQRQVRTLEEHNQSLGYAHHRHSMPPLEKP